MRNTDHSSDVGNLGQFEDLTETPVIYHYFCKHCSSFYFDWISLLLLLLIAVFITVADSVDLVVLLSMAGAGAGCLIIGVVGMVVCFRYWKRNHPGEKQCN